MVYTFDFWTVGENRRYFSLRVLIFLGGEPPAEVCVHNFENTLEVYGSTRKVSEVHGSTRKHKDVLRSIHKYIVVGSLIYKILTNGLTHRNKNILEFNLLLRAIKPA